MARRRSAKRSVIKSQAPARQLGQSPRVVRVVARPARLRARLKKPYAQDWGIKHFDVIERPRRNEQRLLGGSVIDHVAPRKFKKLSSAKRPKGVEGVRGNKGGGAPLLPSGVQPVRPGQAMRGVLHEERIHEVRETTRCKERPRSNKSKGGTSRPFIPWCDRR